MWQQREVEIKGEDQDGRLLILKIRTASTLIGFKRTRYRTEADALWKLSKPEEKTDDAFDRYLLRLTSYADLMAATVEALRTVNPVGKPGAKPQRKTTSSRPSKKARARAKPAQNNDPIPVDLPFPFEYFLQLPEPIAILWETTVYELNPHWLPEEDGNSPVSMEKKSNLT